MFQIIKDRNLKLKLVKYFVLRRWYPQMEVDILLREGISTTKKVITDIDVMGLCTSPFANLIPVLGDCKTLKSQSPINRALWMKGLMDLTGAMSGIIILEKKIEGDHKLTANDLNVTLLSDKDFDMYSRSTANYLEDIKSALCIGENWDKYFEIKYKFPNLESIVSYAKSGFWNEKSGSVRIRHLISHLKSVRNEFNPENQLHISVFLDIASLFAIALNEVICNIFNQYLLPNSKEQLEKELRVIIWGGLENYNYWNQLRKKVIKNDNFENTELSLPEWNIFLQLVRSCLDNPYETSITPLLIKEIAFEYITEDDIRKELTYSRKLAIANSHASRYAILIIDYLCKAIKLPPEFNQIITSRLMKIQTIEK